MKTPIAEVRRMPRFIALLRRIGQTFGLLPPENLLLRPAKVPLPRPRPARRVSGRFDLL
jgi:hypothetical protein